MVIQFPATGTDRTRLTGHLTFFLHRLPFPTPLADLIREPSSRHGITPRETVPARRRQRGTLGTRVKHGHDVGGVAAVGSIRIRPRPDVSEVGAFSEADPPLHAARGLDPRAQVSARHHAEGNRACSPTSERHAGYPCQARARRRWGGGIQRDRSCLPHAARGPDPRAQVSARLQSSLHGPAAVAKRRFMGGTLDTRVKPG